MALFIDGPLVTVDDLVNEDSGLLEASKTCGINVTTKIFLAHDEIATDLKLVVEKPGGGGTTSTYSLGQVVVTPPLKKWETMMSLSVFYRDAYFSQLVDRFQAKWQEYTRLTQTASDKYAASGVGVVSDPVTRAALPLLGSVSGPQSGGTFYAIVAWVNSAGQEGEPSAAASLSVMDGNLMTVTAVNAPANAAGFNVYAGTLLNSLFLQTNVPLPAGLSFTYVPGQMAGTKLPGTGQTPDLYTTALRMVLRG